MMMKVRIVTAHLSFNSPTKLKNHKDSRAHKIPVQRMCLCQARVMEDQSRNTFNNVPEFNRQITLIRL